MRSFHSRYDPYGEASRFLDNAIGTRRPSCLVILGGAADWLSQVARSRFPLSRVISVQYSPAFRGEERPGADFRWYPDDTEPLSSFLLRGVRGTLDGGVVIVPWKPSESAFPDVASFVFRTVQSVLEEIAADAATLRYWSYRWARNSIRNFVGAHGFYSVPHSDFPVVIAAAGPSLEMSLRALVPFRNRFHLWALTSAAGCCLDSGLKIDLLISTDAGLWADRHFDALTRDPGSSKTPIAALLSARIPSRALATHPLVLLSQDHPLEADLRTAAGIPCHLSVPRGTASADALSFALAETSGPILLAGLDMASFDLRSHCRPHGFDACVRHEERRLSPFLSRLWARETVAFPIRSGSWRRGRSFDLYATGVADRSPRPVYRLDPSPVEVPGTVSISSSPEDLKPLLRLPAARPSSVYMSPGAPGRPERVRIVMDVLRSWEKETLEWIDSPDILRPESRGRYLLYALGGAESAGFLAESARGSLNSDFAGRARSAVRASVRALMEMAS